MPQPKQRSTGVPQTVILSIGGGMRNVYDEALPPPSEYMLCLLAQLPMAEAVTNDDNPAAAPIAEAAE